MFRRNILYIYTDGSSLPKPRRGGIGIRYICLDNNDLEQRYDYEKFGYKGATNNQMELYACIEALKHISNFDRGFKYDSIEIRSDSTYVVNHINYAKYTWPKQKWFNRDGKPILNTEIWKELVKWIKKTNCRLYFKWVKAHSKDEDNKAVDRMAKKSAKSAIYDPLSVVTIRRKKTQKKVRIGSVKNAGQKIGIRIITSEFLKEQKLTKYRYEVISKSSKYYENVDLAYSKLYLRDAHSYLVTFNKDDNNPRILKLIREIE